MRQAECAYIQVMVQMFLKGWDSKILSEKVGISYTAMRRKLRGVHEFTLTEAKKIQAALDCGMTLDDLFARKGGAE